DFKELIVQPTVCYFHSIHSSCGTCYGFVETFLFWLLEDLGADKSLMGITVTVGAAFGIPLLMVSSFIINKLGYVNTLTVCSFIYVIRFIGYSLITNPWMAMPFEALESFTNSLLTVTSISYAGTLSNPSTVASMQGLLGGTYHGVGRGVGSLAGGIMIKRLGNRLTFQLLGATSGVAGLVYFLVHKICIKPEKESSSDDLKSQKQITIPNETPLSSLKDPKRGTESSLNGISDSYGSTQDNSIDKSKINGIDNQAFKDKP
ncbi:Major facilitator superfamily domain-containing protein 6, partial [Armadillidium vulgare]